MKQPHITIVTFAWPPRNAIGAHRPLSWAKYWSEAGATVRVLTAKKYAYDAPLDLEAPDLPGVEVIEVDYATQSTSVAALVLSSPFGNVARWVFRRLRGTSSAISNPREKWLSAVMPRVPELAADTDIVVSTYDPKMVHQIGAAIKKENPDLVWVADYRDLWSLNHAVALTDEQRAAAKAQEMETVGAYADLVCSVSAPLSQQQGALVDKPWLTITNGFDIDLDLVARRIARKEQITKPIKIVYTGKIYKGLRDPSALFETIAAMEDEQSLTPGDIRVEIYGGQVEGISEIMRSRRYDHFVTLHGHVTRDVALAAQNNADLLLLLESPLPDAAGVLTGKIFEYMATGVPIVSLGSKNDSAIAQVLSSTQTGLCAEDDRTVIKGILRGCLEGDRPDWFAPKLDEIAKYSREAQAIRLLTEMRSLLRHQPLRERIP